MASEPTLTLHHIQVGQSERIIWLLEELALAGTPVPYNLKLHQRSPIFSPPELAALHPMKAAPILKDASNDLTLAESGAIAEYIIDVYGQGKLKLRPGDKGYPDYLYWFHWSNSGLQALLMRTITAARLPEDSPIKKSTEDRLRNALEFLDSHLRKMGPNAWLAGETFTVADIMIVFSLTTMRKFYPYSLKGLDAIVKYLGRVGEREAYQKAMAKGDPEMDWRSALGEEPPELFGPLKAQA